MTALRNQMHFVSVSCSTSSGGHCIHSTCNILYTYFIWNSYIYYFTEVTECRLSAPDSSALDVAAVITVESAAELVRPYCS